MVLLWASASFLACWIIGRVIGWAIQTSVQEHIDEYKQKHPIPELHNATPASDAEHADESTDSSTKAIISS